MVKFSLFRFGVEIMDEAEFFGRYKRTILDGVVVTWGSVGIAGDVSTKDLVGRYETVLQRDYTGRWDRFIFSLNGVSQYHIFLLPLSFSDANLGHHGRILI